ncbi:mucin-21 [Penaeus vannamei]|uniref:mucin-21 n=1 Tax=Penaeus vannamei TaxID=6689 RepID=UPI00387F5F29
MYLKVLCLLLLHFILVLCKRRIVQVSKIRYGRHMQAGIKLDNFSQVYADGGQVPCNTWVLMPPDSNATVTSPKSPWGCDWVFAALDVNAKVSISCPEFRLGNKTGGACLSGALVVFVGASHHLFCGLSGPQDLSTENGILRVFYNPDFSKTSGNFSCIVSTGSPMSVAATSPLSDTSTRATSSLSTPNISSNFTSISNVTTTSLPTLTTTTAAVTLSTSFTTSSVSTITDIPSTPVTDISSNFTSSTATDPSSTNVTDTSFTVADTSSTPTVTSPTSPVADTSPVSPFADISSTSTETSSTTVTNTSSTIPDASSTIVVDNSITNTSSTSTVTDTSSTITDASSTVTDILSTTVTNTSSASTVSDTLSTSNFTDISSTSTVSDTPSTSNFTDISSTSTVSDTPSTSDFTDISSTSTVSDTPSTNFTDISSTSTVSTVVTNSSTSATNTPPSTVTNTSTTSAITDSSYTTNTNSTYALTTANITFSNSTVYSTFTSLTSDSIYTSSTADTTLGQRPCKCGVRGGSPNPRVLGGTDVGLHEFPWHAALVIKSTFAIFCGGALLSDRIVVTSASCLTSFPIGSLEVLLGEHNINTDQDTSATVRRGVDATVTHPNFDPTTQENNLLLLRLDVPLNLFLGPAIQPICLPNPADLFEEVRATFTGWGNLNTQQSQPFILQKLEMTTLKNSDCVGKVSSQVTDRKICATAEGKGLCLGDKGGPLVAQAGDQWVLVGISIFNKIACSTGPVAFTRITSYLQWISEESVDAITCQ